MALVHTPVSGRPVNVVQDSEMGIFLQDAESMIQNPNGLVCETGLAANAGNARICFAQPFLISAAISCFETDGTDQTIPLVVTPNKGFRIVNWWGWMDPEATVNAGDTLQLLNGSTAISEATTLNIADDIILTAQATQKCATDESWIAPADTLNAKVVLADSDHGVSFHLHLLCARYLA